MKKTILVSSMIIIIIIGFFFIYFGSALFQENNTLKILSSIAKLHITGKDAILIEFDDTNQSFVSKTEDGTGKVIVEKLKEDNWSYQDQMGSAYMFVKGDTTKIISTRLFTKHYFLWNIPTQ